MDRPAPAPLESAEQLYPLRQSFPGRFMLPNRSEYVCRVSCVGPLGALFLSPDIPRRGLSLIAYVEEVGRIEGEVGDEDSGGFWVTFTLTGVRRERFERHLRWLALKGEAAEAPERRHTRFEPRDRSARLVLPDGAELPCEVSDISLSGAAIRCGTRPAVGTWVLLGKTRARVVRHIEEGFAIEFLKLLDRSELDSRL